VLTEAYGSAERLKQMKNLDQSGNIIYIGDYTYNADFQITKEVTQNGQMTSDSKSCSMTYDSLNRLLSRNDTNISGASTGSYAYSYDAAGNITSTSSNVAMSYDNNRLITYNGNNITYDADGNMSNGLLKGVSSDFAYDSENRLIQAGSTTYRYDALNNRIWQTVNGNKTNYVYDNTSSDLSRLLVSTDSNGNSTYYIYVVGLIG
jgi:hypothetical protein